MTISEIAQMVSKEDIEQLWLLYNYYELAYTSDCRFDAETVEKITQDLKGKYGQQIIDLLYDSEEMSDLVDDACSVAESISSLYD